MSDDFIKQLDALLSTATIESVAIEESYPISEPPPPSEPCIEPVEAAPASEPAPNSEVPQSEPQPEPATQPEQLALAPVVAEAVPVEPTETPEQKARRIELSKPIIGVISTQKMMHGTMVLNDVCTRCVCCAMPLTDSVSIQRGLGPLCSSKGYAEDPTNPDEMGAMIALAEYPALVEFLTEHYKPKGVRGLMNGLVRIATLNRKSPVHSACCDAIDALGYAKLAALLRESLSIGHIKDSEKHPGSHHVWIKRSHWTREFSNSCRDIPRSFFDKWEKGWIVPKHPAARRALWTVLIEHYPHEIIKTEKGGIKIPTMDEWKARKTSK